MEAARVRWQTSIVDCGVGPRFRLVSHKVGSLKVSDALLSDNALCISGTSRAISGTLQPDLPVTRIPSNVMNLEACMGFGRSITQPYAGALVLSFKGS